MRRFLIVGVLLCCCGCRPSSSSHRAAASGKVTLDGAEIADGTIAFYPMGDVKGPSTGGPIKDGRYSIAAAQGPTIGRNRVEIRAARKTGRQVQAPMSDRGTLIDETAEAVPVCYNAQSTLTTEIASGENVLDYQLTCK
jgi:hypothetical protein